MRASIETIHIEVPHGRALTKTEEKEMLNSLISLLPHGYVRDILITERADFERSIDCDFVFIDLRERMRAQTEHQQELQALRSQVNETREKLHELSRQRDAVQTQLNDLRATARRLAGL